MALRRIVVPVEAMHVGSGCAQRDWHHRHVSLQPDMPAIYIEKAGPAAQRILGDGKAAQLPGDCIASALHLVQQLYTAMHRRLDQLKRIQRENGAVQHDGIVQSVMLPTRRPVMIDGNSFW